MGSRIEVCMGVENQTGMYNFHGNPMEMGIAAISLWLIKE